MSSTYRLLIRFSRIVSLLLCASAIVSLANTNDVHAASKKKKKSRGVHYKSYDVWSTKCSDKHGSAKREPELSQNIFKNETNPPASVDQVAFSKLNRASTNDSKRFEQGDAVEIEGYVVDVKNGGVESCNCSALDSDQRDTHIELVRSAEASDESPIIVEVTPRIRHELLLSQRLNWSTKNLKKSLKGHTVRFRGYLFFDWSHTHNAYNSYRASIPQYGMGELWRKSCWEVHPITHIDVLTSKGNVDDSFSDINGGLD